MNNLKMKHKKILQVKPTTKQRTISTMKNRSLEEAPRILHQRRKTRQKRNSYPVGYATEILIQVFLDVQNSGNTYQEDQRVQGAYPRTYAGSASEQYSMSAST